MPLFEYECGKCHERSEILVRGDKPPKCPHCGSARMVKQASAFAAVSAAPARSSMPSGCESCCSRQDGTCPRL